MIKYEHATPPSSALSETIESIEQAMENGEHAFIGYIDEQPVAMVRFTLSAHGIYIHSAENYPLGRY
ncbi:hypothetical protein [Lysinibacillus xylanilyticus]|uniref:hypothetical protein n=1 Tax=Lysinibacillus xylanilyticus TaxID=582475 RepID=UPI00380A3F8F